MRKQHIAYIFAVLLAACLASSCLKDQSDLFDRTASARLQESLENTRAILVSPPLGWRMEYFAGNSKADYGGYNYALKFTDTEVLAGYDLDPSIRTTTLWKLTSDDGPVLSFDTYSEVLHHFAIPGWNKYEGMGGDFEFLIISAEPEKIVLQGKRSGKTIKMYPLEESMDTFLAKVHDAFEEFAVGLMDGSVNGAPVEGAFDLNRRQVSFSEKDASGHVVNSGATSFIPTDKGIKFYENLNIASLTISDLLFDASTHAITSTTEGVRMTGRFPDDYLEFENFAGNYTLQCYGGFMSTRVQLVPAEDGTYLMKGLSDHYDLVLTYSKAKGRLVLNSQKIGEYNGQSVYFAAWALDDGGRVSRSEEYGMEVCWDTRSAKTRPIFRFSTLGNEFPTDSFLIVLVDTEGRITGDLAQPGWDPWGEGQFLYMYSLTR
ncbi:MAG: DUF4302 domain-containing protein [Bacteroidales bacterium]|nr:DUF4302 domain-containing protein [Bacteroidales bacterium]